MSKYVKTILFTLLFSMAAYIASADRGFRRKTSKITFNISIHNTLKYSIFANLRSGLNYTGSNLLGQQVIGSNLFENNIITFQKGNTIYILPVKQRILIPQYSPTTGYKLVIRP
jgi:hypothetical protein